MPRTVPVLRSPDIRSADAGVDVLVVSLGKHRQEEWIERYGTASGARVLLAFGASADFLAAAATSTRGRGSSDC